MLDTIQDWLDSTVGQHITIVVFLVLFGYIMYYMVYVLRPMILDDNQQHCEVSE